MPVGFIERSNFNSGIHLNIFVYINMILFLFQGDPQGEEFCRLM